MCKQNKLGHFAIHAAAFAGARRAMELVLRQGMSLRLGLRCVAGVYSPPGIYPSTTTFYHSYYHIFFTISSLVGI